MSSKGSVTNIFEFTSKRDPCKTTWHCWYSGLLVRSAPSRRFSRSETGEPLEGSADSWAGSTACGSQPKTCEQQNIDGSNGHHIPPGGIIYFPGASYTSRGQFVV